MRPTAPVIKDIVLLGGGHSHIAVLRSFGMQPIPGVRLTLISRDVETPYSGMLPGLIAGHYTADQAHIDLNPLARFAGARFIHASVTGVDAQAKTVMLDERPAVKYDILSINTGSTPTTHGTPGADEHTVPVKPINQFLTHWTRLRQRIEKHDGPIRIGIVGGGAGGVELALAVHYTLTRSVGPDERKQAPVLELLTADDDILASHPAAVARRFRRQFAERGIAIHTSARVTEVRSGRLLDASGKEFEFDEVLWVTTASAPEWLAESSLDLDEHGFVRINDYLQSTSHADVFAAGDVATMQSHPRPKAGVFAVRQGPPLTRNLRQHALGASLVRYRPQRKFLTLIGTGDRYAIAARGIWSSEGRWVWRWKDWIDSRFMQRFKELPSMQSGAQSQAHELPAALQSDRSDDDMRCGGCGAKVAADVLAAALADIEPTERDDIVVGLHAPDDAAVVAVPPGKLSVLSIDAFRPMIEDPYVFGQIAANHCLSDLYAMGAEPQTALAIVSLPAWPDDKLAEELRQMLLGAQAIFGPSNTALVGGHTSEGAELSLGFSVTGSIGGEELLAKASLRLGDVLILTKALGTGTLLAADMRAKAAGRWIESAIDSMLQPNGPAATCLRGHGASACTDVTGFGLAGHLVEMLGDSSLGAAIDAEALPVLDGALTTLADGIVSTLQDKNERFAQHFDFDAVALKNPRAQLLFDPQTSGGLLAGIEPDRADACLAALRALGYLHAAVIGRVVDASDAAQRIRVTAALPR